MTDDTSQNHDKKPNPAASHLRVIQGGKPSTRHDHLYPDHIVHIEDLERLINKVDNSPVPWYQKVGRLVPEVGDEYILSGDVVLECHDQVFHLEPTEDDLTGTVVVATVVYGFSSDEDTTYVMVEELENRSDPRDIVFTVRMVEPVEGTHLGEDAVVWEVQDRSPYRNR